MKRIIIINFILFFSICEIALRLKPSLIPVFLLSRYNISLRAIISGKIGLQSSSSIVKYQRNDGGDPNKAFRFKPYYKMNVNYQDIGAVKSVTLDSLGLCNPTNNYLDKIDIITLGDSFTWCTAVSPEDTWTNKLSEYTGLSSYNLSRTGIGVYEYIQQLIEFGLDKNPSYVIMNIYEGNDLRDAISYYRVKNYDSFSKEKMDNLNIGIYREIYHLLKNNYIGSSSYAYNLFLSILHYIVYPNDNQLKDANTDYNFRYKLIFDEGTLNFNKYNIDTDEIEHAYKLKNKETNLSVFDEGLKNFISLAKTYNFIPIVSYIPSSHTTYDEYAKFEKSGVKKELRNYSDALRKYFDKNKNVFGYHFIDCTLAFQEASQKHQKENLLYFPFNLHLTKLGHLLTAKTINTYLETIIPKVTQNY